MKIIYIVILGFVLANCSKDKPVYSVNYYKEIDQSSTFQCDTTPQTGFFVSHFSSPINWGAPCFNPKNRNQIIYRRSSEAIGYDVWLFDLHTGDHWKIAENNGYHPTMSSTGEILVVKYDNQIYSYQLDGSGEKKLTSKGINTFPSWHPSGDKIAFTSSEYYTNRMVHIIDRNGMELDTLSLLRNASDPKWSLCGNKLAFGRGETLNTYSFLRDSVETIPIPRSPTYIEWLNETEILWSGGGSIYSSSMVTGVTSVVRESCWNRSYSSISLSDNGKHLITQTTSSKLIGKDSIYSESNIHLIDLETDEEVKLLVY